LSPTAPSSTSSPPPRLSDPSACSIASTIASNPPSIALPAAPPRKQQDGPIPGCVSDVLSAIFYIASQPIIPGQTFYFPLADSLRTISVGLKAEAKEDIKVPAGNFKTVRVEPTADAGVVKNRGQIWLWYSDDPRHIPVQIKARLFWGTLTFRLVSIDNK
jgi:hypothetical protein